MNVYHALKMIQIEHQPLNHRQVVITDENGKPLSQLSLVFQGSKDFNPRSATPSDVRGNRRIIISLADHGEAVFAAFSVEWIARYNPAHLAGC